MSSENKTYYIRLECVIKETIRDCVLLKVDANNEYEAEEKAVDYCYDQSHNLDIFRDDVEIEEDFSIGEFIDDDELSDGQKKYDFVEVK